MQGIMSILRPFNGLSPSLINWSGGTNHDNEVYRGCKLALLIQPWFNVGHYGQISKHFGRLI